MQMVSSPWWQPDIHEDRAPFLRKRARIVKALRDWFEARDFVEVETPVLQISPGNETHLHAFATEGIGSSGDIQPLMLRTSPEFALKKLLSAGEKRIVEFAPVFRNCERGPLHHPSFTMLEWYRAGEPYTLLMEDCAALLALAAQVAEISHVAYRDRQADPFAEPELLRVVDAFQIHAGIDLSSCLEGEDALRDFREKLLHLNIRHAPDDTWSDLFSRVLTEKIEPQLGQGRATILYEYPIQEAALARPCSHDPRFAERFELYLCGMELANAFGELNDPDEQRRRFAAAMAEKQRLYGESYPLDEDFLAALRIMPPSSGAALGLDRLVMLATHASRIEQVLWAPMVDY